MSTEAPHEPPSTARWRTLPLAMSLALALAPGALRAAEVSLEQRLEILQQEIDEIKAELARRKGAPGAAATDAAARPPGISSSNGEVPGGRAERSPLPDERARSAASAAQPTTAAPVAEAASSAPATTLGSYGEINVNRATSSNGSSQADLRRAVLLLGHRFDDRISLYSEFEIEHAVTSSTDAGEFEVEQAFVDMRLGQSTSVKAGLFLIPLGILNESHEPTAYHGVERNQVETRIIPTTWREGGVGLHGEIVPGVSYDTGLTTTFDAGKFSDPGNPLQGMHQELQLAKTNNAAWYGALWYRRPGLTLGTGIYTADTGQNGASNVALRGVRAPLTLWSAHAIYTRGDFELRTLYARGHLGDAEQISSATGFAATSKFYGWYVEGAYRVWQRDLMTLTPFIRVERYDAQAGLAPGVLRTAGAAGRATTIGLDFKPRPELVFKVDFQKYDDSTFDRFDLGLGWYF